MINIPLRVLPATMLLLGSCWTAWSQTPPVAKVTQVLPFASTGTVQKLGGAGGSATATETIGITTGVDGETSVMLGSMGVVRMKADSEIRLPETKSGHSLDMLKGRLFFNVSAEDLKQRNKAEFRLKTPAALLAVKGTSFFAISDNGGNILGTHEGSVSVQNGSGTPVLLKAGEAVTLLPQQKPVVRLHTEEERAYAAEYTTAILIESPLAVAERTADGETGQYFRQGKLLTWVSSQNAAALQEISPLILWEVLNMPEASLELTDKGLLRLSCSSIGNTTRGLLRATLHPSWNLGEVVGARFRNRLMKDLRMSVNGNPVIADPASGSAKNAVEEWPECVATAQQVSGQPGAAYFEIHFSIAEDQTDKRVPRHKGVMLEMADFVLLTRSK